MTPTLMTEKLHRLAELTILCPALNGVGVHAIARWAQKGVRGPAGVAVRLDAVRVGGVWKSSVEAVGRFIAATNGTPAPAAAPAVRSPAKRKRAAEKADRQLAAVGL